MIVHETIRIMKNAISVCSYEQIRSLASLSTCVLL